MKDVVEIVKSLKGSTLLLEGVSKTIQNEAKDFLVCYLKHWVHVYRAGEGIVRAGYGNK